MWVTMAVAQSVGEKVNLSALVKECRVVHIRMARVALLKVYLLLVQSPMVLLRNPAECEEMHGSTVAAAGSVEAKLNSTMQAGKCGTMSLPAAQKSVFPCSS